MNLEPNDLLLSRASSTKAAFRGPPSASACPNRPFRGGSRARSATGRAPSPAYDAQAHRDRLRPRRARACASCRRGCRGRRLPRPEPADRASGRLRVTMPSDMANTVLAPLLAEFVLKYPTITLEVDLSARFVDLIGENFDVAIRMGDLRDDASLAARRMAGSRSAFTPRRPTSLVTAAARTGSADGARRAARPRPRGGCSPGSCPRRTALGRHPAGARDGQLAGSPDADGAGGAGIAVVNDHFALRTCARGELVHVLPDWRLPPVTARWFFPAGG